MLNCLSTLLLNYTSSLRLEWRRTIADRSDDNEYFTDDRVSVPPGSDFKWDVCITRVCLRATHGQFLWNLGHEIWFRIIELSIILDYLRWLIFELTIAGWWLIHTFGMPPYWSHLDGEIFLVLYAYFMMAWLNSFFNKQVHNWHPIHTGIDFTQSILHIE